MTLNDELAQTRGGALAGTTTPRIGATAAELRKIVTDAYVYGFPMVLREYWPKPEALNGSWKVPPAVRVGE
jgi:hypothetical protein